MEPFVGEIRLFAFPRVPSGWLACAGQLVSISDYDVLYSLIGTTYGGNGSSNFQLPDLRGRVPISAGAGPGLPNYTLGEPGGQETHVLLMSEIPNHSHSLISTSNAATVAAPGTRVHLATANPTTKHVYAPAANAGPYEVMAPQSVQQAGNNLPHNNIMPTLVMNFCIAFAGVYPSQG